MQDKRTNWIEDDRTPSKDDLIIDLIKDQLEEKMQASAMDINVACRNGYVQMSGIVDVYAEKTAAEDIARGIEGIKRIENNITIAMDSNITNKHIEKEAIDKLRKHPNLDSIGVKIEDGVANLIGSTDTLHEAKEACNIAGQVRGVKDVVNNIKIESSGRVDDAILNSRVTQALSTTDLSYQDINHDVRKGKVTLGGYVNNKEEVELAKEIAMSVEGIRKVVNKIKIRKDGQKPF